MSQPGCQAGLLILQPPRCQPRPRPPPGRSGDVAPITGAPRPLPILVVVPVPFSARQNPPAITLRGSAWYSASPLVSRPAPYQDPPESLGGGQNLGQPCLPQLLVRYHTTTSHQNRKDSCPTICTDCKGAADTKLAMSGRRHDSPARGQA